MRIAEDGRFDGLTAFSQVAVLAVSLLLQKAEQDPLKARLYRVFRCAIFFSGEVPEDSVYTWGMNDRLYLDHGPVLRLCRAKKKEKFVYEGGHDVPGSRDTAANEMVAMPIKRTIDRAETVQYSST